MDDHNADNQFDGLPLDVVDDDRINNLSTKKEARKYINLLDRYFSDDYLPSDSEGPKEEGEE